MIFTEAFEKPGPHEDLSNARLDACQAEGYSGTAREFEDFVQLR
jgi:hypothetical protein